MSTDEVSPDQPTLLPEQRVGKAMREARERAGVSLRKIARQLGYHSHTTLSSYERGAVMPTDEVVAGYERILRLGPGMLADVLEAGRIERHGDAWARRRTRIPTEFVADEPAVAERPATDAPSTSPSEHWSLRRWVVVTSGAAALAVIGLVVGLMVSQPWSASTAPSPVPPPVNGAYDGADPKITGCAADAVTLDTVEVFDPPEHLVGDLLLRSSARCGTSWGKFNPVAALGKIPQLRVEIDVFRPADAGSAPFAVTFDGLADYGNMLISSHECVYAQVTLTRKDLPNMPLVRTACMRSAT